MVDWYMRLWISTMGEQYGFNFKKYVDSILDAD